ncbi:hypothetical protein SAMN06269173_111103 [Hymenobacter mucosus]|uniref:Uncharacterized protein n=1 Tax=Hymenobacter mucosus TaxID=1411120 RepID=A0A239AA19_9BACT|nr:hypothetical protein SAMN06269173_111103 [Hymenobacter mucosus]
MATPTELNAKLDLLLTKVDTLLAQATERKKVSIELPTGYLLGQLEQDVDRLGRVIGGKDKE